MRRMMTGLVWATISALALSLGASSFVAAEDRELTNELAAELIREGIGNRPADAVGTRCSQYFRVGSVEITDRRVTGSTAQIEAVVTVHPIVNVDPATILMCFKLLVNRGWRAGGNDVMRGTYEFELWDSGWRLVPRR